MKNKKTSKKNQNLNKEEINNIYSEQYKENSNAHE